MPLLDKNTFHKYLTNICYICLITVHSDMMKKLDKETLNLRTPKNTNNTNNYQLKNLNIRCSIRKKLLSENDPLLNLDVHNLFVENFKVKYNYY
jgi:hypothetical protein